MNQDVKHKERVVEEYLTALKKALEEEKRIKERVEEVQLDLNRAKRELEVRRFETSMDELDNEGTDEDTREKIEMRVMWHDAESKRLRQAIADEPLSAKEIKLPDLAYVKIHINQGNGQGHVERQICLAELYELLQIASQRRNDLHRSIVNASSHTP